MYGVFFFGDSFGLFLFFSSSLLFPMSNRFTATSYFTYDTCMIGGSYFLQKEAMVTFFFIGYLFGEFYYLRILKGVSIRNISNLSFPISLSCYLLHTLHTFSIRHQTEIFEYSQRQILAQFHRYILLFFEGNGTLLFFSWLIFIFH